MAKEKIKVAFIGAGSMANEHLRAFSDVADVILAGIFSRTRQKAESLAEKFLIEKVCSSIDELYSTTQADLVVIAVPELATRDICLQAFIFPWVCLIEKPAGYNLADAQEILSKSDILGRTDYVALNRRHYASTRAVVQELTAIDGQRLVHVYDQENPLVALDAGQPKLVVENWMYANSVHVIDYLRVLGRGEVVQVESVLRWDPVDPGFVMAKVVFSSGDIGIYEAVWNSPGPWAVTVTTHQKRFEMRPLEQATVQLYKSRQLDSLPASTWDTQFKAGFRLQAEEAIKAVRQEATLLPTLGDAFETMKLVRAIYEI